MTSTEMNVISFSTLIEIQLININQHFDAKSSKQVNNNFF
jgi:hypothetical protein